MTRAFALLALLLPASAAAQGPTPVNHLTVHSAAAPTPALKFQLLPPLEDQASGNAATLYYRAFTFELAAPDRLSDEIVSDALQTPIPQMASTIAVRTAESSALQELDLAARRESCDWELTPRLRRGDGLHLVVPELSGFRSLGRLLALRARWEIAQGRSDDALRTCQTGFALSRDLGEAPLVICGIVGIAISHDFLDQVETMMQAPGAPNLYWALSALPHPLVNIRKAFEADSTLSLYPLIPLMRDIGDRPMSADQADDLVRMLVGIIGQVKAQTGEDTTESRIALGLLIAKYYPEAKRFLISHGHSPARVAAMPPVQVVTHYSLLRYFHLRDEFLKCVNLPYWEAIPGAARVEREIMRDRRTLEGGLPIAGLILPATMRVIQAPARLDRRIAALRCIEALRIYAAAHEGRLPLRLDDVTEVPIPPDPLTGKPFAYRVEGNTAILSGPALARDPLTAFSALTYEATLQR